MNKMLIIALIGLSLAVANVCHPSCKCDDNSSVCNSCVDPNSSKDSNYLDGTNDPHPRSCPCNKGYYTSSLTDFKCTQYVNTNSSGVSGSVYMNACHIEIGMKTKDVKIQTSCYFENVNDNSFVVSQIALNLNPISISSECRKAYKTKVQYLSPSLGTYIDVPAQYVTAGEEGTQTLRWPLIELYGFSSSSTVNDSNQISQKVPLALSIGHSDKYVRLHKWNLFVYTNRDQVKVFQVDVDLQQTSGCQTGQECIVIADLDTKAQVCANASCDAVFDIPVYEVGDIFYAKIWFADSTYTKQLSFVSLYFKNDLAQVFDFSSITTHEWKSNSLRIQFPLVEPTLKATIQINMQIDPLNNSRLRNLASASTQTSTQLTATVTSNPKADANSASTSAMTIIFGLVNLMALILLF